MHCATGRAMGMIFLLFPPLAADQTIGIDHDPVACVQAEKFPQFFTRFDPADSVARARLAFRPAGGRNWHSVPMKKEGLNFVGILPKPERRLARFDYYIMVTDRAFNEARTPEYPVDVVPGRAGCQDDRLLAAALPKATGVLVSPPEGVANAAKVPAGFSDEGVVATAPSSGSPAGGSGAGGATTVAEAAGGAAAVAGVAGAAAAAAAAGGGASTALIVAGAVGAGAAVVGVAAVAAAEDAPATTTPSCTQGAGFVYTASFLYQGNQQSCVPPAAGTETHRIRNNSCNALTISSFNLEIVHSAGTDPPSDSVALTADLATRSVGPGEEAVIYQEPTPPYFSCFSIAYPTLACASGPLPTSREDRYTVQTSAGSRTVTRAYAYDRCNCSRCPW